MRPRRHRLLYAVTSPLTARYLMRGQLRFLAGQGFDVWLASAPGPELERVVEREGIRATAVPMARDARPLADLVSLWRLWRALRALRPALVNAGTPKAGLLATLAARLAGVPVRIYSLRGLRLETLRGLPRRLSAGAERLAMRAATRVVCVSPSLRDRVRELGLAPAAKLTVLGSGSSNGVDTERFRPAAGDDERRADRARLGLPAAAPVVGFCGRFTADKGIHDLARAFLDRVLAEVPEAFLLLAGDFEAGDPVAPEVRGRLLGHPRVVASGFLADTAPVYRAIDVLAFPSHREGLPNAPLEAAASGVPVVGYRATGTVDAVADGVSGALVPIGDWRGLGDALVGYLRDAELGRRHGEEGRRRAESEFSRERVWRAWLEEYRRELGAAGLTPGPTAR